jgi:chromosome partitioning protein
MRGGIKMRRIAISNGKGGVGKTTTTANLGAALARSGKRVLLVDMDPQQSLTDFFMVEVDAPDSITLKDLLLSDKVDPNTAIVNLTANLDLIPNREDIAAFESAFSSLKDGPFLLRSVLSRISGPYDYCLIDTPPSLNVFVDQSLIAAQDVLIPLKPNDVDMKATERFLSTVEAAREINQHLKVSGIVFTMVKTASKAHLAFSGIFQGDDLERVVLQTKIRDTVKLGITSTKGQDIFQYDPKGIGAQDYAKLAEEIMQWN